jgi:hypothetical protein
MANSSQQAGAKDQDGDLFDLKVDRIIVRDRIRKDLGDLEPLKESIAAFGLLHPLGVRLPAKALDLRQEGQPVR